LSKGNGRRNSNGKGNGMDKFHGTCNGVTSSTNSQVESADYSNQSKANSIDTKASNFQYNKNQSNSSIKAFKNKIK
jgi:hypothetical protein